MTEKPDLQEKLTRLQEKYAVMGQDLSSYLDGLLYSDYLTYWDYIHLDTLLSLQNPKTKFPDERVFITYHQITELYFSLILSEQKQIAENTAPTEKFFLERLERITRYFHHLVDSFEIMIIGMEKEQFLKFRMALLPASGFQSAQYRLIELHSTNLINLVAQDFRTATDPNNVDEQLEKIYWRSGATELSSGKKTLTLRQFEDKYLAEFRTVAINYKQTNLRELYLKYFEGNETIIKKLREFDTLSNVLWPLAHMRSAGHYLHRDPEDIKATGGTNWQKYLPPRFQRVIFFPELWSEEEKQQWGSAAFKR